MGNVLVEASKSYYVHIGKGILKDVGALSKEEGLSGKALVVSDSLVSPLYMESVSDSLLKSGFSVYSYTFPAGEKSKNIDTYLGILNFLAENKFGRKDTVFALGGGVTGDLAGFCAATYMRGINFVQIPTSLLAMVDSSVGGKTAIDLEMGKNLVGAFYQPKTVICDIDVLKTLPPLYYEDGMAEIIKYAMIYDKALVPLILENKEIEKIIESCVKIKSEVVREDEFEGGIRKILNFGHTVGHAVEKLSNYTLTHGRCVAIGMYIITNALEKRGECEKGLTEILLKMLDRFSLPHSCDFAAKELLGAALHDKKANGDFIDIAIVKSIGKCECKRVSVRELGEIIGEGI